MRALLPPLPVIFGRPHWPAAAVQFQRPPGRMIAAEPSVGSEPLSELSLAGHLLLPVAIFIVSLLSIEFSHVSHFLGGLWASNAVILAALLRHVRSPANYTSILVGGTVAMTLAGAITGDQPGLSAILTLANMVEVGTAVALLSLFRIDASNLASFRNLLIFIVAAGGLAPIPGAVICALTIGPNSGIAWLPLWRNWYVGHALAMIIVAPFVISVTSQEWHTQRIRERLPEVVVMFVAYVAIAAGAAYFRPVIFVLAPAILFATVRFGLIGATLTTLLTALLATAFVVFGIGQPFVPISELSLQNLVSAGVPRHYLVLVAADRRLADAARPAIGRPVAGQRAVDGRKRTKVEFGARAAPAFDHGRRERTASPVARTARSGGSKSDCRDPGTQRDRSADRRRGARPFASGPQENGRLGKNPASHRMGIAPGFDRRVGFAQGARRATSPIGASNAIPRWTFIATTRRSMRCRATSAPRSIGWCRKG